MRTKAPALQITSLFQCRIMYDCHPQAIDSDSDFPDWDQLNNLVYLAAQNSVADNDADIEVFSGCAACFPYITITSSKWSDCKVMGSAVLKCIQDNGGQVDPHISAEFNV